MHRGLADRVTLCGPQDGIVDSKERSVKSSSHLSQSEVGTHSAGGGVLASIYLTMSEVRWFGGKEDDGSSERETV